MPCLAWDSCHPDLGFGAQRELVRYGAGPGVTSSSHCLMGFRAARLLPHQAGLRVRRRRSCPASASGAPTWPRGVALFAQPNLDTYVFFPFLYPNGW